MRERGSVTAEIAVALPALVLITTAALWGVAAASVQVACTDAVRAGARAAARGESLPVVRAAVTRAVPAGAAVRVRRDEVTVRVEVSAPVRAPGLPGLVIRAAAVADTEPGVGAA